MSGSWTTFTAPNTSTGTFNADIMILLTDGSVLMHNGFLASPGIGAANQWLRLTPDSNGNYETGNWSSEIDMTWARQWFASGVLSDGRVFVVGGEDTDDPAYPNGDTPTGEIFDPQTNLWTILHKPSPAFDFVRGDCNGSVLADGRVLLGGASTTVAPSTWSKLTAIWDPNDNSWIQAGLEFGAVANTTKEDPFEEETLSLMPDGSVLAPAVRDTPKAQRYVPSLDQWVNCAPAPVNLSLNTIQGTSEYETGPTILLPTGAAFCIGGTGQTAVFTPGTNPTDLGSWVQGPACPNDTSASPNWPTLTALDAPACLLPNGKVVLLAGTSQIDGSEYYSFNPVFLIYDPTSAATTLPQLDKQPTLPAGNYTWQSCFLLLPNGKLLCSAQSNTLFLYTPDPATSAPNPAWKPANISVAAIMVQGHSYTLSGTQINGLSQAVCYGDDCGMATNYPIVQLTNTVSNVVQYLRSYDFSTMGVATGSTVQSCTIDIPANLATGAWNLVVIANGIASDPVAITIAAQDCFFIVDNSTFSVGEVDTYVKANPPVNAVFNPAFYVVVEGYTPAEINLNAGNLMTPPYLPTVPTPFLSHMTIAFAGPVIPEDPMLPAKPQRFTFPFSITFLDDSMFTGLTGPVPVTLTASFAPPGNSVSNTATITLTPSPNPYILHGDQTGVPSEPWYLSQDIRVFQVVASPGATPPFGVTLNTTGSAQQIALAYINDALNNLRTDTTGTYTAQFNAMLQDEGSEVLQLQPKDPATGDPAYNFAIARVRLRDTQTAANVRVFFRIWQAQQTNASYNLTTYARATNNESPAQPIPVLGVQGDEIITIPFFASPRVPTSEQLHTQTDDLNRHDIDAGSGEVDYFFGCWLDINQPNDLVYPQRIVGVSADGPFDTISPLFPIQRFMVAAHQCLIVEIAYDSNPAIPGEDPSNSDKLAQRNLAFVGAPNPGQQASRRVPQTFEIKPTLPTLGKGVKPDELMIEWNGVPAGSTAEIYLPRVSADTVLAMAGALYTSHLLTRVDAHTLRCPAAGVTYIPIPPGTGITYAGLLTLDLPAGIRRGETYTAVVRQITSVVSFGKFDNSIGDDTTAKDKKSELRQWRRTTGVFKLTIPVSTKELLLEREEQYLSIMKWVSAAIPATSRWYLIMRRYLSQIGGRVTYMGGNPSAIPASDTGLWKIPLPAPHPHREHRFVGKIESLIYDRFGDFEGFTLETMAGESKRFESRERGIEELAKRAWQDRLRVLVLVEPHQAQRPASIALLQ
jgi:hypothetical protein